MIKGKSFHTLTDNSMTQIRNTLQFEVIVSWLIHDSVASLFSIFFLPMHLWLCPVVNGSQWDQPHWIVNLRTWVCALALCIRKRIFFLLAGIITLLSCNAIALSEMFPCLQSVYALLVSVATSVTFRGERQVVIVMIRVPEPMATVYFPKRRESEKTGI